MAKILYVTPSPLDHLKQGSRLRYWAIAMALKNLGHEVVSYSLSDDPPSVPPGRILRRRARMTPVNHWERIGTWVKHEHFDSAIVTHPEATDWILWTRSLGIYTIIDTHNFEMALQLRHSHGRTWRDQAMLFVGERTYFPQANRIWAVSEPDARAYRRLHGLRSVTVMPNVITLPPLQMDPFTLPHVLFVGFFAYQPNIEAAQFLAREVAPILRRQAPEAKILLVGRMAPPWFAELASENVTVVGEVEDLQPYYSEASVVVAPLFHGGGTKLKVIEAMSHSKAIVASANAVMGLDLPADTVVTVPLTGEAWASTITELLQNDERRRVLRSRARTVVEERYSLAVLEAKMQTELELAGIASPQASTLLN